MKGYYIRYVPVENEYCFYVNTNKGLFALVGSDWILSMHDVSSKEFEFICDLEFNETPDGYYIKEFDYGLANGLYRYMDGKLMAIDTNPAVKETSYVKSMYASPEKEYGFTFAFNLELER